MRRRSRQGRRLPRRPGSSPRRLVALHAPRLPPAVQRGRAELGLPVPRLALRRRRRGAGGACGRAARSPRALNVGIVLSWNVAGRVAAQEKQIGFLAKRHFDVLCLQEVTPSTRRRWEEALTGHGLHVAVSEFPDPPRGPRRFGVLIASCEPLEALSPIDVPWPERHLAARTRVDGRRVEVHTLHAPLSNKLEQVKVRTLETLYEALASPADVPRILAGDLNTPRYESREGEVPACPRVAVGARRRPTSRTRCREYRSRSIAFVSRSSALMVARAALVRLDHASRSPPVSTCERLCAATGSFTAPPARTRAARPPRAPGPSNATAPAAARSGCRD